MSMVRGWRTALRIARREARRAKGRSALVVALIGLPVFALTVGAVTYDSFLLRPAEEIERRIGAADAQLRWDLDGPIEQDPRGSGWSGTDAGADAAAVDSVTSDELLAVLPAGSRVVPIRAGSVEMRTVGGAGNVDIEAADLADGIHSGRIGLRDGRAPAGAGEVALTRRAAARLGAGIGDPVHTADDEHTWTVVGIIEYPRYLDERLVVHPDTSQVAGLPDRTRRWLAATPAPVTWEQVKELNQHGILVESRAVWLDPPPVAGPIIDDSGNEAVVVIGVIAAGLVILEVVLLAGPAFAVGARRRQRELALVAATGGTPAQQRRIVLADGVVLGLAGAVVGIGLGVVVALAALPLLEWYLFTRRAGGIRLFPAALAGTAGLAVLTGLLAALVPAAVAARQPVVTGLAGRRGVVRSKKRWLVLGLVTTAAGVALAGWGSWQTQAELALAGLVAAQLGLVLCTPALIGLVARAGRFVPLAPRVALRDTARNRAAAAPAVSAVMAAVAASLAVGMFAASTQARDAAMHPPDLPDGYVAVNYYLHDRHGPIPISDGQRAAVHAALHDVLAPEQVVEAREVACPADAEPDAYCGMWVERLPERECPWWFDDHLSASEQQAARADERCQDSSWVGGVLGYALVDDGTVLPLLTGASPADAAAATAALRAGGIVVADPLLVWEGHAIVQVDTPDFAEVRLPAYALTTNEFGGRYFLSPEAATAVGLGTKPAGALAVTAAPPSQAQEDALRARLRAIHPQLWPYVQRESSANPVLLALAILAGVVALAAAGIATGLATTDRRADLATLGAVGASPRVRRLLSLSQSGVIAGLGAMLGTLAGLGAATAILVTLNQRYATSWPIEEPYPLLVPWPVLISTLLVVPAVAMLGAGLLTRSRLPVERRT